MVNVWCSHNDVDLSPRVVSIDQEDWVCILCKECNTYVGESKKLTELIDKAIADAKQRLREIDQSLDPDFEDPDNED